MGDVISTEVGLLFYRLAAFCLFIAVLFAVVALAFYGRAKETDTSKTAEDARWTMLFATWRDSLIIIALFVADALVSKFSEFLSLAQLGTFAPTVLTHIAIPPVASTVLMIVAGCIALLRILALTHWLSYRARRATNETAS